MRRGRGGRTKRLFVFLGAVAACVPWLLALGAPASAAKKPKPKPKPAPAASAPASAPVTAPASPAAADASAASAASATPAASANASASANATTTPASLEQPPAAEEPKSKGFNAGDDPLGTGVSAAVLLGYGFNDVKLGLGARGGYTLPMKLYLGATFLYHFGSSSSVTTQGVTFPVSISLFYFGVEGGYDILAGPIVVRPFLGLGLAHASASAGNGAASTSANNFAAWPGVVALYPFTPNISAGLDLRAFLVSDYSTFIPSITGAYRF